jgi:secretion/DNA translocation related TadE-like protein
MRSAVREERGSVTIVTGGILVILAVLILASADATRALMAASRAQTAADAAALAAAQALVSPGNEPPQVAASAYAQANGGTLVGCDCATGVTEATVEVGVPTGPFLLLPGPDVVTRKARAVVGGMSIAS